MSLPIHEIEREVARLRAELREVRAGIDIQPARHPKSVSGGSIQYVVVRGWDDPVGDELNVSPLVYLSGAWKMPTATTSIAFVEPNIQAQHYEPFRFAGDPADVYPLTVPINVPGMPLVVASGRPTVLFFARLYHGDEVPAGNPVGEGYIENGAAEVRFAN